MEQDIHINSFNFAGESIDKSLRGFVSKVRLPKEAQQIDRILELFAKRYHECNPDLVETSDEAYAIAFSLLLLHTDAHNPLIRNKMSREVFISNTKMIIGGEKIPSEVLDLMYDNIVASKFTYADAEDMDHELRVQSLAGWFGSRSRSGSPAASVPSTVAPPTEDLARLEDIMPADNPYSYKGTAREFDANLIYQDFLHARILEISGVRGKRDVNEKETSSNVSTDAASVRSSMYLSGQNHADFGYSVRVAKAGCLERKHDLAQAQRKASARGWRPFGILLGGSQLIFFSEHTIFQDMLSGTEVWRGGRAESEQSFPLLPSRSAQSNLNAIAIPVEPSPRQRISPASSQGVHERINSAESNGSSLPSSYPPLTSSTTTMSFASSQTVPLLRPQKSLSIVGTTNRNYRNSLSIANLRPFQIISLADCICVFDHSYTKYPNAFRLVSFKDGQEFLFRANNELDMNNWIHDINYAAALKSAGVRLRGSHFKAGRKSAHSDQNELLKREENLKKALNDIDASIERKSQSYRLHLRIRANFLILIPLQRSTRDKIHEYAEKVSKALKYERLQLQKLFCYRDVLQKELLAMHDPQHRPFLNDVYRPTYDNDGIDPLHRERNRLSPLLHVSAARTRMQRSYSAAEPQGFQAPKPKLVSWNTSITKDFPSANENDQCRRKPRGISSSSIPNTYIAGDENTPRSQSPIHNNNERTSSPSKQHEIVSHVEIALPMERDKRDILLEVNDENGQHRFGSSRNSSANVSGSSTPTEHGTPKLARFVPSWDWPKPFNKIKNVVSSSNDDAQLSANLLPVSKTVQNEKIVRRRSRSNPVLPTPEMIQASRSPLRHATTPLPTNMEVPEFRIGVHFAADNTRNERSEGIPLRDRSASDASYLREDDEISVVVTDADNK
ncbi:hypothetical protein BZG36_02403 [Bifiguratus adelaidae]|uniref:SEC7 domain-containing protein n=1 Tax=Bifiguratus adelaidae TaxID=1938954 RepID=A0A261Y1C0_9FUNG|nr:hypothetical protein BZG36_02403 [Bifiguratus adelaidae]